MRESIVEGSIDIPRPPREVWAFIVKPENFPEYVDGYRSGVVLSDVKEGVGLRFRWQGGSFGLSAESEEEVVEWEPHRRVAYQGRMSGVSFRSAMILEKAGEGTRLTVQIHFSLPVPVAGLLVGELILKPLVRHSISRSLRNVRNHFHGR
ncbi:MAG: SRPBCC family protein [Nitrospirae bacterium]|nr:SRPBCC family protein [Nitrospirota bacterium]